MTETIDVELVNAVKLTSISGTKCVNVGSIKLYKVNNFLIFIYN